MKLHVLHNQYVLSVERAQLHQTGYYDTTLPLLLDSLQKMQEEMIKAAVLSFWCKRPSWSDCSIAFSSRLKVLYKICLCFVSCVTGLAQRVFPDLFLGPSWFSCLYPFILCSLTLFGCFCFVPVSWKFKWKKKSIFLIGIKKWYLICTIECLNLGVSDKPKGNYLFICLFLVVWDCSEQMFIEIVCMQSTLVLGDVEVSSRAQFLPSGA